MKTAAIAVVLALVACTASALPITTSFDEFKAAFGKTYATPAETEFRAGVFAANVQKAMKLNTEHAALGGDDNVFGVTKFSDYTEKEFKDFYLMKNYEHPVEAHETTPVAVPSIDIPQLPTSFNWVGHSPAVVTPVKNQGQCGSCWAFSTAEEIESMWAMAGNDLVELSPQQIVDCDKGEDGCGGGDTVQAYGYVMHAGGLVPSSDYPYTAQDGQCKTNIVEKDIVAKITGFNYATSPKKRNETEMQVNLVANGPISICVDASLWSFYHGGIIKHLCGHDVDHCVQITGYAADDDVPYWIIRNSWGTDWGEKGFLFVEMGKDLCALASEATQVLISGTGTMSSGSGSHYGSSSGAAPAAGGAGHR